MFGFMLLGCLALSVQAETEWCREQRSKCVNKCQPDDIYFNCYEHDGGNEHGWGRRRRWRQRWRQRRQMSNAQTLAAALSDGLP